MVGGGVGADGGGGAGGVSAGAGDVVFGFDNMRAFRQLVEEILRSVVFHLTVIAPSITGELVDGLKTCRTMVGDGDEVVVSIGN